MKNLKRAIFFVALGTLASSLNADTASVKATYSQACASCHGAEAEGNPHISTDAPALNKFSMEELVIKLSSIKNKKPEDSNNKMVSNQKIIDHLGMKYESMEMANYIANYLGTKSNKK
jgi:cytochrome c553